VAKVFYPISIQWCIRQSADAVTQGIFASKLEFTNDFQEDEMMGIASRSNSSIVIRKQAVVAPQVPVSPAVRPNGLGDVAQHGTVSHESTTAPQSNGMNHAMSKYSTKKTHGFWFKMTGH